MENTYRNSDTHHIQLSPEEIERLSHIAQTHGTIADQSLIEKLKNALSDSVTTVHVGDLGDVLLSDEQQEKDTSFHNIRAIAALDTTDPSHAAEIALTFNITDYISLHPNRLKTVHADIDYNSYDELYRMALDDALKSGYYSTDERELLSQLSSEETDTLRLEMLDFFQRIIKLQLIYLEKKLPIEELTKKIKSMPDKSPFKKFASWVLDVMPDIDRYKMLQLLVLDVWIHEKSKKFVPSHEYNGYNDQLFKKKKTLLRETIKRSPDIIALILTIAPTSFMIKLLGAKGLHLTRLGIRSHLKSLLQNTPLDALFDESLELEESLFYKSFDDIEKYKDKDSPETPFSMRLARSLLIENILLKVIDEQYFPHAPLTNEQKTFLLELDSSIREGKGQNQTYKPGIGNYTTAQKQELVHRITQKFGCSSEIAKLLVYTGLISRTSGTYIYDTAKAYTEQQNKHKQSTTHDNNFYEYLCQMK